MLTCVVSGDGEADENGEDSDGGDDDDDWCVPG